MHLSLSIHSRCHTLLTLHCHLTRGDMPISAVAANVSLGVTDIRSLAVTRERYRVSESSHRLAATSMISRQLGKDAQPHRTRTDSYRIISQKQNTTRFSVYALFAFSLLGINVDIYLNNYIAQHKPQGCRYFNSEFGTFIIIIGLTFYEFRCFVREHARVRSLKQEVDLRRCPSQVCLHTFGRSGTYICMCSTPYFAPRQRCGRDN
jgi:hypothetical protein